MKHLFKIALIASTTLTLYPLNAADAEQHPSDPSASSSTTTTQRSPGDFYTECEEILNKERDPHQTFISMLTKQGDEALNAEELFNLAGCLALHFQDEATGYTAYKKITFSPDAAPSILISVAESLLKRADKTLQKATQKHEAQQAAHQAALEAVAAAEEHLLTAKKTARDATEDQLYAEADLEAAHGAKVASHAEVAQLTSDARSSALQPHYLSAIATPAALEAAIEVANQLNKDAKQAQESRDSATQTALKAAETNDTASRDLESARKAANEAEALTRATKTTLDSAIKEADDLISAARRAYERILENPAEFSKAKLKHHVNLLTEVGITDLAEALEGTALALGSSE